jgi:hypothetical protein
VTRPFFAVHGAEMVGTGKWRRTSPEIRGALLTLWVTGSLKRDECWWTDRAAVADMLDAEGFEDAPSLVEKLIAAHWLDEDDGGVIVHDWKEHQPLYRGPSDDPTAKRERMASLRATRATGATRATEDRRGESRGIAGNDSPEASRRARGLSGQRPGLTPIGLARPA